MIINNIKHINYVNDIPKLENFSDLSFIGIVLTSWQMDNLLAYLTSQEKPSKGILIIQPQPTDINENTIKYRITKDQIEPYSYLFSAIFICNNYYPYYNYANLFHCLFHKRKTKLELIRPLREPSLRLFSIFANKKTSFKYTIIDEGLGIYLPFSETIFLKIHKKGVSLWSKYLKQKLISFICKQFFILEIQDMCFFLSHNGKLLPNKKMCNSLRNLYKNRTNNIIHAHDPYIVFFKDYCVIADEDAQTIFKSILSVICDKYHVVIKKHPNDINSEFDNFILNQNHYHYPIDIVCNSHSGEEFVAEYSPKYIIGGYSTVVFSTAFIFNDIPAISYLLLYNKIKSFKHNKIVNYFYHQFKDSMIFIDTIEEINKIIK